MEEVARRREKFIDNVRNITEGMREIKGRCENNVTYMIDPRGREASKICLSRFLHAFTAMEIRSSPGVYSEIYIPLVLSKA